MSKFVYMVWGTDTILFISWWVVSWASTIWCKNHHFPNELKYHLGHMLNSNPHQELFSDFLFFSTGLVWCQCHIDLNTVNYSMFSTSKASSPSLVLFSKISYLILSIYSFIKIFTTLHQIKKIGGSSNFKKWVSFLYKHLEDSHFNVISSFHPKMYSSPLFTLCSSIQICSFLHKDESSTSSLLVTLLGSRDSLEHRHHKLSKFSPFFLPPFPFLFDVCSFHENLGPYNCKTLKHD